MNNTRPYKHILKNLFHEQATELIPLLMPGYRVEQVLNIELPELRTTNYIEGSQEPFAEGIAHLAMPDVQVLGRIETEWIEHSGKFERAYRVHDPKHNRPMYLAIEFQTEREDEDLPYRLLRIHVRTDSYVNNDTEQFSDKVEQESNSNSRITYVYPIALSPFPQSAPAPLRTGSLSFNFKVLGLWEFDAREILNAHVIASYFLLPAMKNADAALLEMAIEELAQRFQHDDTELGRHLSGLSLLLHQSETMPEEEKRAAQEHLKRFTHLIKDDPADE